MARNSREETDTSQVRMNGTPLNGHARGPAQDVEKEDDQTDENIFLFVPNLIGA